MKGKACYIPLGGEECTCEVGNGETWFIKRTDWGWEDSTITYKFVEPTHPDELVTDPTSVSQCIGQILAVYIPLARAKEPGKDLMEFFLDGKDVGLPGAESLLAARKDTMHCPTCGKQKRTATDKMRRCEVCDTEVCWQCWELCTGCMEFVLCEGCWVKHDKLLWVDGGDCKECENKKKIN